MTPSHSSGVHNQLSAVLYELGKTTIDEPLDVVSAAHKAHRELDRISVSAIAEALVRSGGFARRNRISITTKISDSLGIDRAEARRLVSAAVHLHADVTSNGMTIPPRLPATADAFAAGGLGLGHVQVIVTLLRSRPAELLSTSAWADVESQLATQAGQMLPADLRSWGRRLLIRTLPKPDGPRRGRAREETNELTITPHLDRPGGTITARLDDAEMFSSITCFIDTHVEPRASGTRTTIAQRRARVLSEFCAQALRRRPPNRRDRTAIRVDSDRKRRGRKRNGRSTRMSHRGRVATKDR
ncbi:DUF222 domain-containing protein [Actinomycetes bacterium KLBMP 9759]